MSKVLFAAGAVTVYPCIGGYPIVRSPSDITKLPGTLPAAHSNTTCVHVFSSCPMGENRAVCAANSFGRVHGVDHMMLADASLLCGPTVVNPQGTVMAIAHRNAQAALERGFADGLPI